MGVRGYGLFHFIKKVAIIHPIPRPISIPEISSIKGAYVKLRGPEDK